MFNRIIFNFLEHYFNLGLEWNQLLLNRYYTKIKCLNYDLT